MEGRHDGPAAGLLAELTGASEMTIRRDLDTARRVIAAADGSKLSRTAHAFVGPSALVHTLVTDTTAPPEEVAALEKPAQ